MRTRLHADEPVRLGAVLAPWPATLGAALFLLVGRGFACDRDPYQYGNAWAEDDLGYCTHSGLEAMTSGPGGFVGAWALLAVTVGLPLVTIVAGALLTRRARLVWTLTIGAALAVLAFFVLFGHTTIVGGAGG
jgi:hypothetical protein